jgi:hypothetical protein
MKIRYLPIVLMKGFRSYVSDDLLHLNGEFYWYDFAMSRTLNDERDRWPSMEPEKHCELILIPE